MIFNILMANRCYVFPLLYIGCPPGMALFVDKCYFTSNVRVNFEQAREICEEHTWVAAGTLVMPETLEELYFLKDLWIR